uniref:Uncharacterized protein n=1 Tax=Octopus bimaculoides TaxID=37653 RepID=A0A0L8IGC9_OCTBM
MQKSFNFSINYNKKIKTSERTAMTTVNILNEHTHLPFGNKLDSVNFYLFSSFMIIIIYFSAFV